MAKHLTLFATKQQYEAWTANTQEFIMPNVSVCKDTPNKLFYHPIVSVSGVEISKSTLSLNKGETEVLVTTVLPSNASNKNVIWSSSDDSVATVSSNGFVAAIGAGNAAITVTTVDGGYTAQCSLDVIDPYGGHDYVDLGLPSGTKWAKCNIGATSETEFGNYYQYGKGAAQYAATSGASEYSGTESPLAMSADTVAQLWGGNWHMPTQTQFEELTANTTYQLTTISGVKGVKFTATNGSGNYIFIPNSGWYENGTLNYAGEYGYAWSSSPASNDINGAWCLYFGGGIYCGVTYDKRIKGYPVRAVVS